MLLCRVNFLDDTHFTWELERHAVGHDLFNNVCEHLNLLERDYFGLAMLDSSNTRMWLDCAKEIRKQIKGPELEFFFNIKFYPPDPSGLAEDITRYLLCLQLRKDIVVGRLPCPSDMLAVLGSYTIQSTLGDYDPSVHTNNYVSKILLAPNQNEELEKSVMEQHSTHRSMSPAQADMLFLEYAKTLPMYGVDLHPGKDVSGADVMLGVCSEGLMVYEDEVKINSFSWPNILKISHKRKTFILKIRPSEDELDGDVSFTLPSYKACKQLWKCSVESHAFFRNRLQDTKAKKFLPLGSRFRYHGRTQSECLEASVNINRDPPQFTRIATKRKANDEILEVLKQPVRTEVDDWSLVHDSDKWDIAATSDDVMLESKEVWESKQRADDWFVLLENSKISSSGLQKPPQTGEERKVEIVEDKESQERYEDELVIKRSYKVHMEQEGPVELKVMEGLARDILEKEHPELMGPMNESLTEEILQVNGERIQKVVITKQWVQEGSTFVEPHEDAEIKTERVETVRRHVVITEGGEMLRMESEKPSERLEMMERRLNEVEAIEQKLLEVEELRVGLQELESLEQRLRQAEREGLQQGEMADWNVLLDRSTLMPTAPFTADEELEQMDIPKPMGRNDDWYILLEMSPRTISVPPTDMISSIPGEDQAKEVSREAERKIQLTLPEMHGDEATVELYEEVTQSRVIIEEEEEEEEQVKVSSSGLQKPPQTEKERKVEIVEENESQERYEDELVIKRSYKVDMEQEGPVELKVMEGLARDILEKEHPELMGPMNESLTEEILQVNGERIQKVVITKQWVQEDSTFVEPNEDAEIKTERVETVRRHVVITEGGEMLRMESEKPSERLEMMEQRLNEVEAIEQKLEEEEEEQVKVDYRSPQTVFLKQPQRDLEDDWFILLDVSSKTSVPVAYPLLRSTSVEVYDERREEVQREKQDQQEEVTLEVRKQQPVILEQRVAQPQRDFEDDWFVIFDVPPKGSVPLAYPLLRSTTVEVYEERREEPQSTAKVEYKQQDQLEVLMLEQRAAKPQRDVEDDWSIAFDVSHKETVPLAYPPLQEASVELYEESKGEVLRRSTRREEERIEMMTVSTEQTVITEKTMRVIQTPQVFPVVPREIDDDWFQLFDQVPYEQKGFLPDFEEQKVMEKRVKEEREKKAQQVQVTVEDRRSDSVILEHRLAQATRDMEEDWSIILGGSGEEMTRKTMRVIQTPQEFPVVPREIDDDWFQLFDQVPYEQKRFLPDFEEQKVMEKRVKEEQEKKPQQVQVTVEDRRSDSVILEHRLAQATRDVEEDWSVILGGSGEEMTRKTMRVIQTPQEFPVVPREIDDDWFQMFDQVPYEQRSFPSDVKSRDIWVREPTKDQRIQRTAERVTEERLRGKSVTTEERRVIFEERRERVHIIPQVFPVGVREVDDDWSQLLDPTPFEKRAVPLVSVGTEEQRMKAREDIRVRQQEKRVRDDVEIRMRPEMRKRELEVRRSQPAVIVQTVAQPQREVEDDWFLLFDVSPKQSVAADVIKVDKRAEEVRRREVERRMEEERRRREEARKMQIKVDDREKRQVIQEKRPVRLRREEEDDWFTLMGVSPKDSVVSPVALPKPRTQILVDQPFTSTPTAQPVSVTKTTYRDRTKDTLDITLESEADESVSIRKSQRWTKRIEGESIYVRHSILMLEDFDVTQEVILRHHESVRELKRIFMEGAPDFGPTEWDRRLSSYSPTPKAQLPHANGEILISMGLIDDGKTVL
ncbi:protein 4.1b isoform X2 [Misgurnus anguillicaudatus]|uniref:protein 4.1b isoform X2 n=1 Tax=Misgurnus anguillicaudatus TaxID=75329 RepID=UPI003CCF151D